eukprot:4184089-Amphidinium_carterae.1
MSKVLDPWPQSCLYSTILALPSAVRSAQIAGKRPHQRRLYGMELVSVAQVPQWIALSGGLTARRRQQHVMAQLMNYIDACPISCDHKG